MTDGRWCPAAYDESDRATWRCNLLPSHVGPHDDGIGDVWGDLDGPGRLQTAAVCLLGSYEAWDEIRDVLRGKLGDDLTEAAVQAIGGVLRRWAGKDAEVTR